ncbi:hypothetical protein PoB_004620100 [Plakobranchus ocellatus]|uniref:Uncharacterized protein n=1 Tax=Plakobranchus ocellatus TaxID=259542 RepID=A0AAV4BL26_9GAST|nr:hypothetical protein PoB_004620100 [Plakobranchus ocellatus]
MCIQEVQLSTQDRQFGKTSECAHKRSNSQRGIGNLAKLPNLHTRLMMMMMMMMEDEENDEEEDDDNDDKDEDDEDEDDDGGDGDCYDASNS